MDKKSTTELRSEKFGILTLSFKEFIASVKGTERSLYSRLLKILRSFKSKNGVISPLKEDVKSNKKKLLTIKKDISKAIIESTFERKVKKYTKKFDRLEVVAKELISRDTGIDIEVDVTDEKNQYVDKVLKGLLGSDSMTSNVEIPIREILYRQATSKMNVSDAESQIRNFMLGKEGNGGKLVNRARFYAHESIQRFNGLISQKACEKYNLNVFKILNPLINTSEQVCKDMIEMTGEIGKLAVAKRTFLVEDIPKIVEIIISEGYYGKELTAQTFFMLRNHWGCVHDFICTKRTDEWIATKKEERSERLRNELI